MGRVAAVVAGATVALSVGAALTGCSSTPDEARAVQSGVGRLGQVASVDVTVPTTDRAAAIRVTYAATAKDPAALAAVVTEVEKVAAEHDYPAYRLTLVPTTEPDSELVVDDDFGQRADAQDLLRTWLLVTDALLGPVTYDVGRSAETITVDSRGGAGHDVAEARRIRPGFAATTWVFRSGAGTFTATGRIRAGDVQLFQAVQRNAGAAGQAASVSSWQLDRRDSHVRLDLDVELAATPATPAALTVGRYGRPLAPLVHNSLVALRATGRPSWLRLHARPDMERDDTFASWSSGQAPARGRDPLDRGWDAWLAAQALEL